MKEKKYNEEDSKYSNIISMLNDLPEVKAPRNFEYNLMIKIQNGQFETERELKRNSRSWIFIPGTAVALSAVLLFIIFFDFSSKSEAVQPSVDMNLISKIQKSSIYKDRTVDSENIKSAKASNREIARNTANYGVIVRPNDVVETPSPGLPFNQSNSVDLDSYIDGNRKVTARGNNQAMLASGGGGVRYPEFNGFYLRQREQAIINMYKARLDSIAKFMSKQMDQK